MMQYFLYHHNLRHHHGLLLYMYYELLTAVVFSKPESPSESPGHHHIKKLNEQVVQCKLNILHRKSQGFIQIVDGLLAVAEDMLEGVVVDTVAGLVGDGHTGNFGRGLVGSGHIGVVGIRAWVAGVGFLALNIVAAGTLEYSQCVRTLNTTQNVVQDVRWCQDTRWRQDTQSRLGMQSRQDTQSRLGMQSRLGIQGQRGHHRSPYQASHRA